MDDLYDYDCSKVLESGFERRVTRATTRLLHREQTWHDRVFNKCASQAAEKRLREINDECLDNPDVADDCDELGEAAAYIIVQESGLCVRRAGRRFTGSFQRACREEARDACEDGIHHELDDCGADASLRTVRPL